MIQIKQNCIFIADSHYNTKHTILKKFLLDIDSGKIKPEQLILMGDIFDFLSSYVTHFVNINKEVIDLINSISLKIEVIYFEGNHDFLIQDTFPLVKVYKRENQPLIIKQNGKKIALAHGDIYTPSGYNLYTYIIRTKWLLKFLNIFDIKSCITKRIEKALLKKDICKKHKNFEFWIKNHIEKYDSDLVIEGHFHQNLIKENYVNIPSLCCDGQYVIFRDNQFNLVSI